MVRYVFGLIFRGRKVSFEPSQDSKKIMVDLGRKCNIPESTVETTLASIKSSDQVEVLLEEYQQQIVSIAVKGLTLRTLYELFVSKLLKTLSMEVLLFASVSFTFGGILGAIALFFFIKKKNNESRSFSKKDSQKLLPPPDD